MKKTTIKIISLVLVLLMLPGIELLGTADFSSLFEIKASANDYYTSGYCGEITETNDGTNLSWVLDDAGTLTISGIGRMRPEAFNIDLRIKSVVIGEGVENIANKAFYQCSNLTSITFPSSLTEIDEYSFYECFALTGVSFSDEIIRIGAHSFQNCDSLQSITLPKHLLTVEDFTFSSCENLSSIKFNEALETINIYAFSYCPNLTSVELKNSLKSIGEGAFFQCKKLEKLNLGNSIETIGVQAFASSNITNQNQLEEIIIPDSVVSIGKQAFQNCGKLKSLYLGSGVNDFPINALDSCAVFQEFKVSVNNQKYSSYDGVLYNKTATEIIKVPLNINGEITLPATVRSFSYQSVSDCKQLTSINVDDGSNYYKSVDGILYSSNYYSLICCPPGRSTTVTVAENTKTIGKYAFYNCQKLQNIIFNDTLSTVDEYAFQYCNSLESVSFPNSLKTIGRYAFYNCSKITSVKFPDLLTTIGSNAFNGCSLTSAIFGNSLQTIGSQAFANNKLKNVIIPDSVTLIDYQAFEYNKNLITATIGSGVTNLTSTSFVYCTALEEINISEENQKYYSYYGVVYNKDVTKIIIIPEGFNGKLTLPNTFETFYWDSVSDCSNITEIYVEEGNKKFKSVDGIIYSADGKTLIRCPEGRTMDVVIADDTETIGSSAFSGCALISYVKCPDSLTIINNSAFSDCSKLTTVEFGKSLKTIGSYSFLECRKLNITKFPDSLVSIGNNAFLRCGLKSIEFGNSLQSIGSSAFYNSSVVSVKLPDSLQELGSGAFNSCYSLKEINIPPSIKSIGSQFSNNAFVELTFPETLQNFESFNQSKIKTLTIKNKYCEYSGTSAPGIPTGCAIRAYCGSPGHTLATKRLLNFESLGHTYLDWYVFAPATFEADGIERRDCAYCDGYEERVIPQLQKDVFTATFVADGEVVASVEFPKGTTEITEPAVPAKDRYLGEWENYTLSDENITINAIYTIIKSNDASDIKTDSSVIHYTGKDDVLFKLKSSAEATVVKSTITNAVPLDIVLVVDQSGSMDETLGGKTKKVDALKDAATAFVNTVYENGKLTDVDHRISIVGFGLSGDYSGFEKNENTELLTSANGVVRFDRIKPADYANSLLSVSKNGVVNPDLTSAIKGIEARGATAADLGFEMAKGVFANTDSTDRQRVVVFMTDGEPTYLSGFQTSVANSAIANAYTLKTAYDASVYSVGVFSSQQSSSNINKFMNAVSSGYPDARSMTSMGKGTDGQFYTTVEHTDSLASVFKSISTESLSHTAPFDDISIIKTLSDCVTLTSQQEQALRIDLIRQYGITNDDIIITRNENGTTTIQINSLSPEKVEDDKGNVTYEVAVEFFASLNENATTNGEYIVDTEDSGIMLGEDAKGYETTFDISSITLDTAKTRIIFTINGEVYEISENIENGYAVAPEMEISEDWTFVNWKTSSQKATNGLVLDATLVKAYRTVTWHTDSEDIIQTYVSGDFISAPEVGANANGDAFLSWNRSIPTTMPDENLEFIAVYGDHVHNYTSEITLDMTCLTNGIRTFTCSCGDSYEEAITATGHNYESITPSLEKDDAKCTFVCTYCGDKYDYALDYQVITASGKRYNVLYEFQLTDDNLDYGFQPDGEIQVRIPLSELHTNAKKVTVIRTNDDGSTTDVPAVLEDGFLIITCDHFTPYEVKFDITCEEHVQGEWIVTKEATCTEDGSRYAVCTECEETIITENIPKTEHIQSEWIIKTEATCTEEGSRYIHCTECEAIIAEETIPMSEHKDSDGDGICDIGSEELKPENICDRCGKVHTNFFAKLFCFIKYLIKRIFGF